MNMAKPGSYNGELNTMLRMNNLPEVKAPSNPPSLKTITKTQEAIENENKEEEEQELPTEQALTQDHRKLRE